MKKILIAALTIVMSTCGAVSAFAAPQADGTCPGNGQYFVDENGDGVCDYYGTNQGKSRKRGFGNGQGLNRPEGGCGICRSGNGSRNGAGANFVDNDQDGICDNIGTGLGQHNGNGNYTDVDQDGVCDNIGTGLGQNRGNGRGQNRGNHGKN